MASVTPFLARNRATGETVVVLGFPEDASSYALCAGSGVGLVALTALEVVRAAADWPRPHSDSEETDRIFGPRKESQAGPPARSALRIDARPAIAGGESPHEEI